MNHWLGLEFADCSDSDFDARKQDALDAIDRIVAERRAAERLANHAHARAHAVWRALRASRMAKLV